MLHRPGQAGQLVPDSKDGDALYWSWYDIRYVSHIDWDWKLSCFKSPMNCCSDNLGSSASWRRRGGACGSSGNSPSRGRSQDYRICPTAWRQAGLQSNGKREIAKRHKCRDFKLPFPDLRSNSGRFWEVLLHLYGRRKR